MPEHLRSLVVILFLASSVFYFLRAPAIEIIGLKAFTLRRNLWFGVTLIAFASHNYWIYAFLTWGLLLVTRPREKNRVSLFIFLLFAVPTSGFEIPGFGLSENTSRWGFNYYIYYRFPFRDKPQILKKPEKN